MDGVHCIDAPFPVGIPELGKIRGIRVPVEENDMVLVNRTNCCVYAVIEMNESFMLRIRGFVQRIVPSDPRIVFVVFCEFFPKPYGPVLEVLVIPKRSIMSRIIRVPSLIMVTQWCLVKS